MTKSSRAAEIAVVLDETGSMEFLKVEAVSGFNDFLKKQQDSLDGLTRMSVMLFSRVFDEEVFRFAHKHEKLKDIKPLVVGETYQPRGGTPLYDAIGTTIDSLKQKYKKGDKVIVFILSDGEENDSREYDSDQIKELVKECLDLEWKVIYLGSNISEMYGRSAKTYAATTLGIPTEDSETFGFVM